MISPLSLALAPLLAAATEALPPLPLARTDAAITIDGQLDETVWQAATLVDTFYDTSFGDNRKPTVATFAYLLYDGKYLYAGFRCADPDPSRIRAPFSDRDTISTADDSVALMLDARNDRRSAQVFRVSPRGVQNDALFNDANQGEDTSPDFFFESAGRITKDGWEAEMRIPLSSLRYGAGSSQTWGFILRRNYPRDRRYSIYSVPIPRDYNCIVCHERFLTGITGLPSANHVVVAPYVSGQSVATRRADGSGLGPAEEDGTIGVDVKWNAGSSTALDATIRPDFSQVEADIAQIAVNNRFALFYTEKRPFFLEGVDLFDTPIQAVYTRTITSPRWGTRVTGKIGSTSYTLLGAEDRGGGSVVLPGPEGSDLAAQDFRSTVGVARLRHDLGSSFVGFLSTGREVRGGGHNVVFGPDFQWRRGGEAVSGQLLFANTRTPFRPDLAAEWDARRLKGHALSTEWSHTKPAYGWTLRYKDFGDDFRADAGFVPQVGYRQGFAGFGATSYPRGFFNLVNPFAAVEITKDRRGAIVNQHVYPSVALFGKRNLYISLEADFDKIRSGGILFDRRQVASIVQVDPSRKLPRISVSGNIGEQVDFVNNRLGHGGGVRVLATLRPTIHLNLQLSSSVDWLSVDAGSRGSGRLFTAQVQRLKATYNFDRRAFLRTIGQWVGTTRNPALYLPAVRRRSGQFAGSALFGYRLNWQSALFVGYGDDRALDERNDLVRADRQLFVKLSYAWQR